MKKIIVSTVLSSLFAYTAHVVTKEPTACASYEEVARDIVFANCANINAHCDENSKNTCYIAQECVISAFSNCSTTGMSGSVPCPVSAARLTEICEQVANKSQVSACAAYMFNAVHRDVPGAKVAVTKVCNDKKNLAHKAACGIQRYWTTAQQKPTGTFKNNGRVQVTVEKSHGKKS